MQNFPCENESHANVDSFAPRLALKQRLGVTRKWPITRKHKRIQRPTSVVSSFLWTVLIFIRSHFPQAEEWVPLISNFRCTKFGGDQKWRNFVSNFDIYRSLLLKIGPHEYEYEDEKWKALISLAFQKIWHSSKYTELCFLPGIFR